MKEIVKEIVENWEKTGLLKGLDQDYKKAQVAILLENQRMFNDVATNDDPVFKRVSIPLVRRVYGFFLPWELISVQSQLGPMGLMSYVDKHDLVKEREIAARTKLLHSQFQVFKLDEEVDGYFNYASDFYVPEKYKAVNALDAEAGLVADLALEISNEISREVLNDLRSNVATKLEHDWKSPAHLEDAILVTSNAVFRKIGHAANWVVTSHRLAESLATLDGFVESEEQASADHDIFYRGTLANRWKIFVDVKFDDTVLMGFRGTQFQSGYFYTPYIPLSITPQNFPRHQMLTRYGKSLLSAEYYASIAVNDYSVSAEE